MLNVVALMGRMATNPELKKTAENISVASFAIAVDRSYGKAGEGRQADFIDVIAWRAAADFVCKYFSRGRLVAVDGSIQTRSHTGRHGNRRKAVEIVANQVHFAEPGRRREKAARDYEGPEEISENDLPF